MINCFICKKSFTRKEHLERHIRSHRDEKPFSCENCQKGFGRKDLLTRHKKSKSCVQYLSDDKGSSRKRLPRCQFACQGCILSKCRCVRSNGESGKCDRCLKRNTNCISRKDAKAVEKDFEEIDLRHSSHRSGELTPPSENDKEDDNIIISRSHSSDGINELCSRKNRAENKFKENNSTGNDKESSYPNYNEDEDKDLSTDDNVSNSIHVHNNGLVENMKSTADSLSFSNLVPSLEVENEEDKGTEKEKSHIDKMILDPINSISQGDQISNVFSYSTFTTPFGLDESYIDTYSNFNVEKASSSIKQILQIVDDKSDSLSDILDNMMQYDGPEYLLDFLKQDAQNFNSNNYNDFTPRNISNSNNSLLNTTEKVNSILDQSKSNNNLPMLSQILNPIEEPKSPRSEDNNRILQIFNSKQWKDVEFSFRILPKTRDLLMVSLSGIQKYGLWEDDMRGILPSTEQLTMFVTKYFKNFHRFYQILHIPTFDPNNISIVLLVSVLACGAYLSGDSFINIGKFFFEMSRRMLIIIHEKNDSNVDDIDNHQASLLNCICGSWLGLDKTTEFSENNSPIIASIYRRKELLKRYKYRTLQDIVENPEYSTAESKWKAWLILEKNKTMVFSLFYWSVQFSIIRNLPPVLTNSEMELPLPHFECLWMASNANEWVKLVEITKNNCSHHYTHNMSYKQLISVILSDYYLNTSVTSKHIPELIIGNVISTIKIFIIDFNNMESFAGCIKRFCKKGKRKHSVPLDRALHNGTLKIRLAEIVNILETIEDFIKQEHIKNYIIFQLDIEYSYICLYCSIKDCMKMAGVDDEFETQQSILNLLSWYKKKYSRIAVWHCGQLLKWITRATSQNIHIPYAPYLVFHASLVLWSYGMLHNMSQKSIHRKAGFGNYEVRRILITEDWSSITDEFIQNNDIIPFLNSAVLFHNGNDSEILISYPETVMEYCVKINESIPWSFSLKRDISNLLKNLQICSKNSIYS